VHLVGFIIKKFVTMHGHMNVKFLTNFHLITLQTFLFTFLTPNFCFKPISVMNPPSRS